MSIKCVDGSFSLYYSLYLPYTVAGLLFPFRLVEICRLGSSNLGFQVLFSIFYLNIIVVFNRLNDNLP